MSTPKVTQKLLEEQKTLQAAKKRYILELTNQMRTPMNVISGMIDISKNNVTDSHQVSDCLDTMMVANREIQSLVEKIQDMAYLEEEVILDTPTPVKLTGVAERAIRKVCSSRPEYHGKVSIDSDVRHHVVIADDRHLTNAFTYVVDDVIKSLDVDEDVVFYMREKFTTSSGNGMYELTVSRKWPADGQNRSYESQVTMARARMLFLAMGGSVEINPLDGYDQIRLTQAFPYGAESDVEVDDVDSELESIDFWGMRILVAEDNVLNMQVMEALLKEQGIIVTKAWNGKEAVEIFEEAGEDAFDLVILDVKMPVMNGYEAAEEIRAMDTEYAKDIIIFTVTAEDDEESVSKIFASGIDRYFLKPVNVKEILKEYIRMTE
ncbi:MAG: response regulator [Lachnospiraceae bacterium]|nr:response regulator [Lachnospiraceae bacterium]